MSWFHIAELIGVVLGTAFYTYFRLKNKREHNSHLINHKDNQKKITELENRVKDLEKGGS